MPTYVYHCTACTDTYEVDQRITENALTTCRCGSEGTIKRIIQPIAVMFKGSGFHINDYAASTASTAPKTEATPESKPATEAPKTEATPAPTPATTESTTSP